MQLSVFALGVVLLAALAAAEEQHVIVKRADQRPGEIFQKGGTSPPRTPGTNTGWFRRQGSPTYRFTATAPNGQQLSKTEEDSGRKSTGITHKGEDLKKQFQDKPRLGQPSSHPPGSASSSGKHH